MNYGIVVIGDKVWEVVTHMEPRVALTDNGEIDTDQNNAILLQNKGATRVTMFNGEWTIDPEGSFSIGVEMMNKLDGEKIKVKFETLTNPPSNPSYAGNRLEILGMRTVLQNCQSCSTFKPC